MYFINKSLIILVGSILVAIGINFFLVPFHLLDGGGTRRRTIAFISAHIFSMGFRSGATEAPQFWHLHVLQWQLLNDVVGHCLPENSIMSKQLQAFLNKAADDFLNESFEFLLHW